MQNVSAALRMSMPEIIRQYLRTFELRQELEQMRSLSSLRKIPRWLPMRDLLVRRSTRKMILRSSAVRNDAARVSAAGSSESSRVVYMAAPVLVSAKQRRPTGTE
jgi:hypothetical protein